MNNTDNNKTNYTSNNNNNNNNNDYNNNSDNYFHWYFCDDISLVSGTFLTRSGTFLRALRECEMKNRSVKFQPDICSSGRKWE